LENTNSLKDRKEKKSEEMMLGGCQKSERGKKT